jgi:hypothetical protein
MHNILHVLKHYHLKQLLLVRSGPRVKLQSLLLVHVNANYPGCWMLLYSSAAVSIFLLPEQISEALKVESKFHFQKRASDQS